MKKLLIICLLHALTMIAYADVWDDEIWTNGEEMLCTRRLNDTQVLMIANGYTDAGYGYLFETKRTGNDDYDIIQIGVSQIKSVPSNLDILAKHMIEEDKIEEDNVNSSSAGIKWERKMVGHYELLLRYDSSGRLLTAYLPTGREMKEEGMGAIKHLIAGKYTSRNGQAFAFSFGGNCIWNGKQGMKYRMVAEGGYGNPSCHFMVGDSQYEFVLTKDGMHIYNSYHQPIPDEPKRGKLFAQLTVDKSSPRWEYLSLDPLLMSATIAIDKDMARLMRNEIYARHGYRFTNPELKAYFKSCKWYVPVADNSMVKLNDMELLNVELLKRIEQ